MKSFFFFILLLPVFVSAQDCKIKSERDPYTKQIKLSTGLIPFNKGIDQFHLTIDATKTEIDLLFALNNISEAKCFDGTSIATIIFEGSKVKTIYRNTAYMNCDGLFQVTFKNTPATQSALEKLATKKITSIILTGNNKAIHVLKISEEQKQTLMDAATCMIKESKILIQ